MNKTKLTLLAFLIFATANIQGSNIFTRGLQFFSSVINPLSKTEQLYAAICTLDLPAVQGILAVHPEEANKTNVIASGFKWVTEKCNILAPRIVSTVTGC